MQQSKFRDLVDQCHERYGTSLGDAVYTGSLPKRRLPSMATQFYLQEKWPSHIAHVYLSLDDKALSDREMVKYILAIIKAENLGVGSKGISHSALASRFARFVGVDVQELRRASPTSSNRALMDWCDLSALERPWLEALAVQMACESQADLMAQIAKGVRRHYGASPHDAAFWSVHGGRVEKEHARRGFALLAKYTTPRNMTDVLFVYEMTCRLHAEFCDSLL